MVSRDIDDVVERMGEHMETLASPLAPTTMSVEDEELLVEILGNRNGYGHAGRPAGARMVAVDDGTGDDEDGGGGLSRWYKQTDIASEMSQRTLNSIIEDADLSDPQLLELVLLLDGLARWQFHAPGQQPSAACGRAAAGGAVVGCCVDVLVAGGQGLRLLGAQRTCARRSWTKQGTVPTCVGR